MFALIITFNDAQPKLSQHETIEEAKQVFDDKYRGQNRDFSSWILYEPPFDPDYWMCQTPNFWTQAYIIPVMEGSQ